MIAASESTPRRPRSRTSGAIRVWTFCGGVLLLFGPSLWRREGSAAVFTAAETPIDRPSLSAAAQWRFLSDARTHVEKGESFTIAARDPSDEMNLYMMSIGIFAGHFIYPNSYFGIGIPGYAAHADVVLDFGCLHADEPDRDLRAKVRGGCVERRRAPVR
jgi:hypothetical protein